MASRFAARTQFLPGRVYLEDIRGSRLWYCKDLVKFFVAHGLSYRDFRDNGVSFEALQATDDSMALAAIESAKAREAGQ